MFQAKEGAKETGVGRMTDGWVTLTGVSCCCFSYTFLPLQDRDAFDPLNVGVTLVVVYGSDAS